MEDFDLAQNLMIARDTRGKSLFEQVREIARFAFSKQRLTPQEYFRYRLFDDRLYDAEAKGRFIGERSYHPTVRKTCDLRWWALGTDKLLAHSLLVGLGVAVPRIHAVVHPFRIVAGAPTLRDADEVATYLRGEAPYPLFQKPVSGVGSHGIHLLQAYDAGADAIVFHDETTEPVDAFVQRLLAIEGEWKGDGHVLQEVLVHHPDLVTRVGPAISSIRVLVVVGEHGPQVLAAAWKVIGGHEVADNTWRPGNLLAGIDVERGQVTRLVDPNDAALTPLTHHPTTQAEVVGTTLPDWDAAVQMCLRASAAVPKLRFQGWDVALCEDGPKILELNTGSSFEHTQFATGEGMLTPEFEAFVTWAEEVNETPPRGVEAWFQR